MRFGSICSGVDSATLAWEKLGWEPVFFAEVEPFPCAVLHHRFGASRPLRSLDPAEAGTLKERRQRENWAKENLKLPESGRIPNFGDFTKITKEDYAKLRTVDLIIGGTPCQDFSVAGKGAGFSGSRGTLTFAFVKLLSQIRPEWFVWENVPGVLSKNHACGFVEFLRSLNELGYDVAWRTLDAQYVRVDGCPRAVPQRRRRVFVVGSLTMGRAAEVLFERDGVFGNTPPRRNTQKVTSGTAGSDSSGGCFIQHQHGGFKESDTAETLTATEQKHRNTLFYTNGGKRVDIASTLDTSCKDGPVRGNEGVICVNGAQDPVVSEDAAGTVARNNGLENVIVYETNPTDARITENKDGASQTLISRMGTGGGNLPLVAEVFGLAGNIAGRAPENGGNGLGVQPGVSYTLDTAGGAGVACAVFPIDMRNAMRPAEKHDEQNRQGVGVGEDGDPSPTLTAVYTPGVAYGFSKATVRRLTPLECERLMGYPDNHTRIPWHGKPAEECPDGPRYKACGNGMCVNVIEWLGRRIEMIMDKYKGN